MKIAAYKDYKPADSLWLPEIPATWQQIRGRFVMGVNPSPVRLRDLEESDEVSFVPMEAVGERGGLSLDRSRPIDEIGSGYTEFEDGDVIVAKITPCFENGKAALAEGLLNGVAFGTTELHVLRAGKRLDKRFLFYLTTSHTFLSLGESEMYGAGGQKRVPPEFAKDFRVPLPPIEEQQAIARFLDAKTAQIDTLVAKKRQLIDKLKEKRSALIARTVTRGLPPEAAQAAGLEPNPEMKDSGVDWIGKIPKHWEARRMKNFGDLIAGAGFPHEFQGQEDEELTFYKVGDLANAIDGKTMGDSEHTISRQTARLLRAKVVPIGAVVYAKIGAALLLNRRRITARNCCIDNNMTAFIPKPQCIDTLWAYYWLSTLDFGEFTNPGAIPSLSEGYQAELPFLAPPLAEQKLICSFLDRETSVLDQLTNRVEAAMDRLAEYRQALITSAVTGKIDVREIAA